MSWFELFVPVSYFHPKYCDYSYSFIRFEVMKTDFYVNEFLKSIILVHKVLGDEDSV